MKVLALAIGIAGLATTAQALPLSSPTQNDLVTTVAGGCGPGFHPNPWGRCVPFRRDWDGPRRYDERARWRHDNGEHRGWRREPQDD